MKRINIVKNGREFEFYCEFRNTRHGFAHDCRLFINNDHTITSHCYYLNRTWERYTYESVALQAINTELQNRYDYLKAKWLHENGYIKMTKHRKAAFEMGYLTIDPYYITCKLVKKDLSTNMY